MKFRVIDLVDKERGFEAEIELTEVNGKLVWKVLSIKYKTQIKRKEIKNVQPSFERSLGIC